MIQDAVVQALQGEGYCVLAAGDGAEALRVLENTKPWLVLLDMRLPIVDGWTFAREARARSLAPKILVMTAARDAGQWAREIEADGFLAKPFQISELLDAVEGFRPHDSA